MFPNVVRGEIVGIGGLLNETIQVNKKVSILLLLQTTGIYGLITKKPRKIMSGPVILIKLKFGDILGQKGRLGDLFRKNIRIFPCKKD